ncbi:hypothetical protein ACLESO_26740 [Pyxidicoccus sp. 3LG]
MGSENVGEQIDGAIYTDGLACLVETKDQTDSTGFEAIAKLTLQLQRRPASTLGLLFSTSEFTTPLLEAVRFHPVRNVLLWKRTDIDLAMEHGMRVALWLKWTRAVEQAQLAHWLRKDDFR